MNEGKDDADDYLPYQLNEDDLVQLAENRKDSNNNNTIKDLEINNDNSSL